MIVDSAENTLVVSGFWAKVLAGIATAGIAAGAAGALGTWTTVLELRTEVRAVGARVTKLERNDGNGKLDDRLRKVEDSIARVETKIEVLIDRAQP